MMPVFRTDSLEALQGFADRADQLAIVERAEPEGAAAFFEKVMANSFGIAGKVHKDSALEDISAILDTELPESLRDEPFYSRWLEDMAMICAAFCDIQQSAAAGFWLGSERGCRRYHIDNVPQRMLVTYAGMGTEWLPDEAADRQAFAAGAPNEKIVTDPAALQYMKVWDVAVFRGGPQGLLHRTPDAALNGPSILMRLDHASFWDNVLKHR